jgi:two-component system, NtrC family, sensor kinase
MGRGPKPAKSKEAKPTLARKSPKDDGARVRDLEKQLAEALRDKAEAQDQRTAISEILRAISASPMDLQTVLEGVVRSATRFCGAHDAELFRLDGTELKVVAHYGPIAAPMGRSIPLVSGTVAGRAALERRAVHVADLQAEPAEFPVGYGLAREFGYRTVVCVPLLLDGKPVGTINLRRTDVSPFTDEQITLLQTFADQAVIAIENVRLFNETKEALERQTATAEILRVISGSPTDLQPVFDTIVRNAVSLCGAAFGGLHQIKEGRITIDAQWGMAADDVVMLQRHVFPLPLSRGSVTGRAILDRAVIHIPDIREDPEYRTPLLKTMQGYRTLLGVPMIREGISIGALALWRPEVRPFSETEIGLVRSFADQAVIAIENVRLFNELQTSNRDLTEALEQQTATSELLKVIGRSTFDLQPVFETLAENAVRLCEGRHALIFRFDGRVLRIVASYNISPELKAFQEQNPIVPGRGSSAGRAAVERRTVQILDARSDPEYTYGSREVSPIRTLMSVPMLRAGELLGTINIVRYEVSPFTDSQIALMETFADQAAIAIENARLLTELQARTQELTRSVGQLTALAEVG